MDSQEGVCQLDLMLIWEAFDSKEAALLYPVNSLRNYARMQVECKSGRDMFFSKLVCGWVF